jgi:hypothetical protein
LACIILITGILLGSIALTKQIQNRNANQDVINQWETKCFVFQYTYYRHQCNYCNTNNSNCPVATCYDEKCKVSYLIFNGSQILSQITTINKPNKQNFQV